ncbi:MAG TPA: alanine racemase, partial [Myxococcales bacterium]|nr:alanine racemase [Myxococcales bacterium]
MAGIHPTWIELHQQAIEHNIGLFRRHVGEGVKIMVPIKANAYGHGLQQMAVSFEKAGVDWFGVHSLEEAFLAKEVCPDIPVLILGYVPFEALERVVDNDFRLLVSSWETAEALARTAAARQSVVRVHIKIETGTHRQGVNKRDLQILARFVSDSPHLHLEGGVTHFANIEDTTDHSYAMGQLEAFHKELEALQDHGIKPEIIHSASSAATMLFKTTHFDMVRPGLSSYGLWPSRETYVSLLENGRSSFPLQPVLSWKTVISLIKDVPAGKYIGYGCSYRTTRDIKLAVLPIGYYDGYDRGLSNIGYVLIRGQRAPIRGRICMNLTMVDVTDIQGVKQEDEVVLIGEQGDEKLSVDLLASMIGSINYEVVARIGQH